MICVIAPLLAVADVVDFETMAANEPPRGWQVAMTDGGAPPLWRVIADASSPAEPKVLAQLSEDRTSGRFPLAIHASAVVENAELAVRFKPVSGRVDRAAGLVWRYRDENNYYVVRANALENNVVLYKVENGRRTPLSPVGRSGDYGVEHEVPAGHWSVLGITFDGARFSVTFDGQPLFDVVDETFGGPGRVGLWTKADSVTYFDGFSIEEH
jgi:hypothetical protein